MAAPVLIAAAALGTAFSAYGQYTAAKSKAAQLRQQAFANTLRASEILKRNSLNNELLQERSQRVVGDQQIQFAGSGRAQSATTLAMMSETFELAAEQAQRNTRAAQWEATMIIMGADSDRLAANSIEKAGKLNAFGTLLFGGAQIASSSPGLGGGASSFSTDVGATRGLPQSPLANVPSGRVA